MAAQGIELSDNTYLDYFRRYFTIRRLNLYGAALARIGIGAVILQLCLVNYFDRRLLWGPDGPWSLSRFEESTDRNLSLYSLNSGPAWFEFLFGLQIVVTVLYIAGYRGRMVSPLFAVLTFSLLQRNGYLLNGGENLLITILPFLALLDSTRRLSVDSLLRRGTEVRRIRLAPAVYSTIVHNAAVVAIIVQVCIVYVVAGMYKVRGTMWTSGEALYYIMGVPEYGSRLLQGFLAEHPLLMSAMAYSTIVLQVTFPVFVFFRRTRVYVLLAAIVFHLAIAVVMALPDFSFIMIATEMLLLDDPHYRSLAGRLGFDAPRKIPPSTCSPST